MLFGLKGHLDLDLGWGLWGMGVYVKSDFNVSSSQNLIGGSVDLVELLGQGHLDLDLSLGW